MKPLRNLLENEITKLALERVESELRKYRAEPFLEEKFSGIRKYDQKLIELLKKGETIDSDHPLRQLRVSPRETDRVKAVSKQLENLEAYGLVEKTRRGWRWVANERIRGTHKSHTRLTFQIACVFTRYETTVCLCRNCCRFFRFC
jgi:hypothetical protein